MRHTHPQEQANSCIDDMPVLAAPQHGPGDGVSVAGMLSEPASPGLALQHRRSRLHVFLLLHVLHWAAAKMEKGHHQYPDMAIRVQVSRACGYGMPR